MISRFTKVRFFSGCSIFFWFNNNGGSLPSGASRASTAVGGFPLGDCVTLCEPFITPSPLPSASVVAAAALLLPAHTRPGAPACTLAFQARASLILRQLNAGAFHAVVTLIGICWRGPCGISVCCFEARGSGCAQSCFRTSIGTDAKLTRAQACVVCGSAEEDDDGACTSCGTVVPVGKMLSDIDGRAPAFGYQVTTRAAHTIAFS